MMDETFKDWWASQPSIDYEEMCIASEAWDYQDKRISTLRAEVAELKAANRWISVEDRLPNDGQRVLSRYSGVYECRNVGFWKDLGGRPHFGYPGEEDGKGSQPATHWQPLPPPPEAKQ